MMSPIKCVVVAAPRSATGWAAAVLRELGLLCSHEGHFRANSQEYARRVGYDWGDSSWMAVPFIRDLPEHTVVLHQTRDPLDTIPSLVALHHFDHWDRPIVDGYHAFMRRHMRDEMPEGEIAKAAYFWLRWNEMIEDGLGRRRDLHTLRYRVEEETALTLMYTMITLKDPSAELLDKALAVPADYNHKQGRSKPTVTMDMLSPEVQTMARRYGYG